MSRDQLQQDALALATRLGDRGGWQKMAVVTRGGLVPAAILAAEIEIRLVDAVCVTSYDNKQQGRLKFESRSPTTAATGWWPTISLTPARG